MDLSIVIPIYNSGIYLERCLNSIVNQSREGIELILVDDGSTDDSPEICDRFSKQYPFIKVLHQKNMGQSGARNKGMELAAGKWISFVDSDDYVADDFIQQIFGNMEPEVDFLLFETLDIDAGEMVETKNRGTGRVQYYGEAERDLFVKSSFMGRSVMEGCKIGLNSAHGMVYRRSMLKEHDILFKMGVEIGEDMLFNLQVYQCFYRTKCIGRIIYYYLYNADSIINRYKPHYDEIIQSYIDEITPWLDLHPEYKPYHSSYRLHDIIMYMKYDFFHRDNHESRSSLHKRMKKVLLDGRYKEDYRLARKYGIAQKSYGISKRIVFWAAVHGHFGCLRWIAYMRYGRRFSRGEH